MSPLLTRVGRMKMGQYLKGQAAFKKLTKEAPNLVEVLFERPDLVDLLLKSRGEVKLTVASGNDKEKALKIIKALGALNPKLSKLKIVLQTKAESTKTTA